MVRCNCHNHAHDDKPKGKPHMMDYQDYELQSLFEGICEQVLDYLGIEDGRIFLYKQFASFRTAVDMKIDDYKAGNRITVRLDTPDESIIKICDGWKHAD